MTDLYLHNRKVNSVFQLLGDNENDISYSVAWALANCPTFLDVFLRSQINRRTKAKNVLVRLQQAERTRGITDIEIESPGDFYIIIEAKRGWKLPGLAQLKLYAERRSFKSSEAPTRLILALVNAAKNMQLQTWRHTKFQM